MEYRQLGASGFKVPVLSLGTGTFGGGNELFRAWGASDVAEATRLVDVCLEHGLNMFDSADGYSTGMAEEILGQAIKGRRDQVIISTKGTFRAGPGPNDVGSSRYHLIRSVEGSLRRLGTDWIDLYQLHAFDALTPIEEAVGTLDDLVRAGKIRYIGCSNFSGWHLMKSLAVSEKYGLARYVAHQAYYSLIGRDYEWELMPLALDQRVSAVVWSPLGWGRLTGKVRRGQPLPPISRLQSKTATDYRPAGRRRACLPRRRRSRLSRPGNGQDRAANRAQLALAAAQRRKCYRRRTERRPTAPKPGRRRLEPDSDANCPARRSQCDHSSLSLLASKGLRGTKPVSRRLSEDLFIVSAVRARLQCGTFRCRKLGFSLGSRKCRLAHAADRRDQKIPSEHVSCPSTPARSTIVARSRMPHSKTYWPMPSA